MTARHISTAFLSCPEPPCPPNPYIDDRAEEVPDAEMNDGPSDGESDSEEARVRRQDRELFKMPEILATHEARLREVGPYRIPTHLLPSGAATPARHEDQLEDIAPRAAPSPTIPLLPPIQTGLARTDTRLHSFQSHSPPAAFFFRRPWSSCCQRTPLFLADPDSRGPTPFSQRARRQPSAKMTSGQTNSGPPPRKKLKTSHFKASAFLDLAAELSGDDDDSGDDQNEDEETLSDKVADAPDDDGDELRAIARHYEMRPLASSLPRSSSACSTAPTDPSGCGVVDSPHRGELSFVMSAREVFTRRRSQGRLHRPDAPTHLPHPTSTPSPSASPNLGTPPQPGEGHLRRPLPRPSPQRSRGRRQWGVPSTKRAAVPLEFEGGPARQQTVRMARIAEFKDGRDKLGRFDVEVCHLKRHILDAFGLIQMHDRVCVVSGVLHRGLSGRGTDLSDGLVWRNGRRTRVYRRRAPRRAGPAVAEMLVRVIRGQFTGSVGLNRPHWVGRISSNAIPQAERSENSNTENLSDEVQAQLLPTADMDDIAEGREEIGGGPLPRDNNDFAEISRELGLPLTAGDVHERDRRLKDAELKFAYTGTVSRALMSRRRAPRSKRKGYRADGSQRGSNQRILVHIEDAQHLYSKTSLHKARNLPEAVLKGNRPKREPPPQVVDDVYLQGPLEPAAQEHYPKLDMPLVGEGDGTWVRAPEFRHVRIDVRLSGLNTIPKVSDKILKLEGHNGYLLAGDKSNNGKIIVRGGQDCSGRFHSPGLRQTAENRRRWPQAE
ncbi:hypothetical protein B0H16DRAFT_1483975 [Mycena metata]|uniref:Uncharacterized protein n=1 Tax=Mycena metata TaxID=1033252 RepID=A0AAD7DVB6_9AGAR|nr:hypothetical protein B0H16DRAFT_1483975 [Mycena metata]